MSLFHEHGGLLSGDATAACFARQWVQPVSTLAKLIVSRHIVHFYQRGVLMLPLFQFDFEEGCVRSAVEAVIDQLRSVLDDDELAQWFVLPHAVLRGTRPVQAIVTDPLATFQAARETHFARV